MRDFPPLAWFTSKISVPRCLVSSTVLFKNLETGEVVKKMRLTEKQSNSMALHRIALGFPVSEIPVVRWKDYPGYDTAEGRELNETAIDLGDNPNDWWVSEEPVDVLKASEVWTSHRIMDVKLRRNDVYLKDVHRMVSLCREHDGRVYIPPSWITEDQARQVSDGLGVPIV